MLGRFYIFTGLLGGLMGLAASKISSAKSTIAQATGSSVGQGRLATGMLTYAGGNVNEMTEPGSLTPGRHYNVDGADGRTYRAKYMGKDARTHITTGPEFHLVGEKGREAIIDAHTTRSIQMNDPEIWRTIQTLYNGGSMSRVRSRRGRGVRAFADGNLGDFDAYTDVTDAVDPFPLSAGDKENIRLQIAHGSDAHQIGTYSSTIFKYCVFYRGYWYFIAYHVYNKKVMSVMPFNILKPEEKQMFFRYKERREVEKQYRTVQDLDKS